jgi:hypothetical protein
MSDVPSIPDPNENNLVEVSKAVKQSLDVTEGRTKGDDLNFVTLAELYAILRNLGFDAENGYKSGADQDVAKAGKDVVYIDTDDQTLKMGV